MSSTTICNPCPITGKPTILLPFLPSVVFVTARHEVSRIEGSFAYRIIIKEGRNKHFRPEGYEIVSSIYEQDADGWVLMNRAREVHKCKFEEAITRYQQAFEDAEEEMTSLWKAQQDWIEETAIYYPPAQSKDSTGEEII